MTFSGRRAVVASWLWARAWVSLVALAIILTAVARLVFAASNPRTLGSNELALLQAGSNFWGGHGLGSGPDKPLTWSPPVTPVVMGLFTLGSPDLERASLTYFLALGMVAAGLGSWLGWRVWKQPLAALAAGVAAECWTWTLVIPSASGSMTEPLAIAWALLLLVLLIEGIRTGRLLLWGTAAVVLCLAWQSRAELLAGLPILLLAAGLANRRCQAWRVVLLTAGVFGVSALPFLLRVHALTGTWALSTVDNCFVYAYRLALATDQINAIDRLYAECRAEAARLGLANSLRYLLDWPVWSQSCRLT